MENQYGTIISKPELTAGTEFLNLVLNNLEGTFLLVGPDLRIQYANHLAKEAFKNQLNREYKPGMSVLDLVENKRHQFLEKLYSKVFQGQRMTSEIEILQKDGSFKYFENIFNPARNADGIVVGAVVTSREITEKKLSELNLEQMEERWRFALEGANQGVWDWNMDTNKTYFSNSYKKMYSFAENEIESHIDEWKKRVHPDDLEKVESSIKLHADSPNPFYESIYRIKGKDELYKWVLTRAMMVRSNEGRPLRMIGTHTDITERKTAEENYKILFYNNPLPMWTYDLDTFRFRDVNHAAVSQYGYTREEFLSMTIMDIRPESDKSILRELLETRKDQDTFQSSWTHRKKNGELIFVEVSTSKIALENENTVLVLINDITEKVKVQNDLLRSNERFAYAVRASSEALWEWNTVNGNFYISETYTDITGWREDKNLSFENWHDRVHPEDKTEMLQSFYAAIADHNADQWTKEYRYLKSDGSYTIIINKAVIVRDREKKAGKVIGAIQDISNQKKVEEALRKSNERFLLASMATSDAIYDWDILTNDLYWGDGVQNLFGYDPHEISFSGWLDKIPHDDRNRIQASLHAALDNKHTKLWKEEYYFTKSGGNLSYVLDRGFIERDNHGKAIRMIGSMQDITDLKYNEKLISLERSIFELSTNPDFELKYIIEKLLNGLEGLHPGSFTSVNLLNEDQTLRPFVSPRLPEIYSFMVSSMKMDPESGPCGASMNRKQTVIINNIEESVLWKNDTEFHPSFEFKACCSFPIINGSNAVMGSFAIYFKEARSPDPVELNTFERSRNILRILIEHQRSLNEIKVANERFDIMMKATHDLIWDWNLENNIIYRDEPGLQKVYGISNNTSIRNLSLWLDHIHPEDREKVKSVINSIIHATEEDKFDVEYRFLRDDGNYSFVYDRGIIIRNQEGKPVRMIGAAQNITEWKRLEQELLSNELDRQKAINQATVDTQEQERSEIGKELHDNVNQVLTTTKLYLDLALSNPELKEDLIRKSSKNIIMVINEIRQLSRTLMDPSIGDLGLMESINDLIENINITRKLHVRLVADKSIEKTLNKNHKLTIFRIIQETLNNVIKHAKATTVVIEFEKKGKTVILTIQDDGIGFKPEHVKKGAGLKNIQNRIYLIDGIQTIQSSPDQGSKMIIEFPVS